MPVRMTGNRTVDRMNQHLDDEPARKGRNKCPLVYAVWYVKATMAEAGQLVEDGQFHICLFEDEESVGEDSGSISSNSHERSLDPETRVNLQSMPGGFVRVYVEGRADSPDPVLSPNALECGTYNADGTPADGDAAAEWGQVQSQKNHGWHASFKPSWRPL